MKNLFFLVLVVGAFISAVMWIDFNLEALILLPSLFSIPIEVYLLWIGILLAFICFYIISLSSDKKEAEIKNKKKEERLERAERIMRQHQADVASGKKHRLQMVTLSNSKKTPKEKVNF